MNTTDTTPAHKNMVLFSAKYPEHLEKELRGTVDALGIKVIPANISAYKSDERYCKLYPDQADLFAQNKAEIAGAHVQIVMHMQDNPNEFFVDAINTVTTVKDYNPASIHVIMPYAPFARQDHEGNFSSCMAKTFPKHLKFAGADFFTTIDEHSVAAGKAYTDQFGKHPELNLQTATYMLHQYINSRYGDTPFRVGGADGGDKPHDIAQHRAYHMAALIAYDHYISNPDDIFFKIAKTHIDDDHVENTDLQGDVAGYNTLIVDDMVDRGGTLLEAAMTLEKAGSVENYAVVTHGVFSDNSMSKLTSDTITLKDGTVRPNPIQKLIVTDSILSVYDKAKELTEKQRARLDIVTTVPLIQRALLDNFLYTRPHKNLDTSVVPA